MPHQCLKCGHWVPEDASALLLQGCPTCKGTRFFYTRAKVENDEREKIASKAQKDIRQVVNDMLQDVDPESGAALQGEDGWKELKARDLRKLVKKMQEKANAPESWENPDVQPLGIDVDGARARATEQAEQARQSNKERPDTVNAGDGSYDIDVRGLMEKNPIVVHKDGAYMIHLPSLFDQKGPE